MRSALLSTACRCLSIAESALKEIRGCTDDSEARDICDAALSQIKEIVDCATKSP